MKIKIIKPVVANKAVHRKDTVVDLSEALAKELIAKKFAVEQEAPKAPETTEPPKAPETPAPAPAAAAEPAPTAEVPPVRSTEPRNQSRRH